MNIAMISNSGKFTSLKLYDESLKELARETFEDIYTLNFFLQTIPKNFGQKKTLLIYRKSGKSYTNDNPYTEESNQEKTGDTIQLSIAEEENSYFINE
ncbi:MAG TPA: hypothetical protein VJR94_08400 [Candidatus Nitrosocosmicus sp.]|nr:hypothetical protein [Candidatus Nitrosocosmicus sp.]